MKRSLSFLASALLTVAPLSLHAQALPTASRSGGGLQVGAELSIQNDDYAVEGGGTRIAGISGYATYDIMRHIGVEGAYRSIKIYTPTDIGETAAEGGLRYFYTIHRFQPFVRAMAGIGGFYADHDYSTPYIVGHGTYFEYSFGGGLDIRLNHHLNIRAIDFEQQEWPSFSDHGLSPSTISFGAAYRFH